MLVYLKPLQHVANQQVFFQMAAKKSQLRGLKLESSAGCCLHTLYCTIISVIFGQVSFSLQISSTD